VLRTAVKRAASIYDGLRPPAPGVAVLIYHRVGGGSRLEVDLDVATFDAQMEEIRGRTIRLDAALRELESESAPSGPTPIVVTFDDGTADFAEHALPVLVRHGVQVTLYVATRFVDEQIEFPDNGRPLSWTALRDCISTGLVTVGSHTHTHALLDRLTAADIDAELDRSQELIRSQLQVDAEHFAYPKAVDGSAVARAAVVRRFRSAAVAGTHSNVYGDTDPYRLARSPVQVSDGMEWFRRKIAGGLRAEDGLRRALNRVRYAGAST
jgi:peptidoglycan/xylan/chitin deacetylase (PgdA/CDA1 family)